MLASASPSRQYNKIKVATRHTIARALGHLEVEALALVFLAHFVVKQTRSLCAEPAAG